MAMLIFCILFFSLALLLTGARVRYISPILPFLVILSCYGIRNISVFIERLPWSHSKIFSFLIPVLLVTLVLSFNGRYLLAQFSSVQPISYLNGSVSRDEYISSFRSEYPVILYANQHLPKDSKTLCVFLGNRGYYMNFPHAFATPANYEDLFTSLLFSQDQSQTEPSFFSHLLIRDDLTTFWINNLDDEKKALAKIFFVNKIEILYKQNGYSLFRIYKKLSTQKGTK
jgi:hypothetical protein